MLAGLIAERREKVLRCRREQERLRSLGAGLLLQYGLWRFMQESDGAAGSGLKGSGLPGSSLLCGNPDISLLCGNLSDISPSRGNLPGSRPSGAWEAVAADYFREEAFQSPGCFGREAVSCLRQLSFHLGASGKPYIDNLPVHFNLSHSGRLVACGISDQEIGVDIQEKRSGNHRRLWERFFTEEEKALLKCCCSVEEEETLFYRLWTAKEAYGKLTGRGLTGGKMTGWAMEGKGDVVTGGDAEGKGNALQISPWMERDRLGICCLEYQEQKGYQGMACYYQSKGEHPNEETNDLFEGL